MKPMVGESGLSDDLSHQPFPKEQVKGQLTLNITNPPGENKGDCGIDGGTGEGGRACNLTVRSVTT